MVCCDVCVSARRGFGRVTVSIGVGVALCLGRGLCVRGN